MTGPSLRGRATRTTTALGVATALAAGLLVTTAVPAGASVPVRCHPQAASIGGGAFHTLVVDNDGNVRAAGDNYFGQIGDGTLTERHNFVAAVDLSGVTSVATSPNGSHSVALKNDGTVWAWGINWNGQLGNGSLGFDLYDPTPKKVPGISGVVSVAAGSDHTLALTEDGTVWAWGRNDDGQLGNGTSLDSPVPVQVEGLTDAVAISAGSWHSLAVKANGEVYAWGDNRYAQLGIGYIDYLPHMFPTKVPGLSGITAVAGGGAHSVALKSNGIAYGWGDNHYGGAGNGAPLNHYVTSPSQVANVTSITAIAAGYWHAMALKSDGTVWTWGWSTRGQLGNGWVGWGAWTSSPIQVSGISSAKVIAAPGAMSMVVRSTGQIRVWGDNGNGQLGLGDTTDRTAPATVPGITLTSPSAPTNVEAVAGEKVALVTWEAPEAAVTQYVVVPYRNGIAQPPVGTKLPKLEYAVPDLTDGATYWFEVKGQNCLGEGTASSPSNRVVPVDVQTDETGFSIEGWQLNDRHTARINVSNGNLKVTATDLQIAGTGLPLVVSRAYNSRAQTTSIFGANWATTLGADIRLEILATGSVYFHGPGGSKLGFAKDGTTFTSPAKIDSTLTENPDGSYTLKHHFSAERLEFSDTGQLVEQVDRNGNSVTFTYDASGDLEKVTDTQGRDVTLTYDGSGRVETLTDVAGREWHYAYDTSGRLTDYTDPVGGLTKYHYDTDGRITKIETPGNAGGPRVVEFGYDVAGRAVSLHYPLQAGSPTTTFDYQVLKTVVTDGNGSPTTYHFDAVGRTTKVVDALGNSVSTTYTSNSNVKRRSVGSSATHYTYSTVNALTGVTAETGSEYSIEYGDSAHPYQATKVTDPQGNETTYSYDTVGNLVTQTHDLPSENQVGVDYDTGGRGLPVEVSDTRDKTTGYDYDNQGNLVEIIPPAPLGTTQVTYDGLSRIAVVTDGKGQTTTYDSDDMDRVTKVTFGDGSTIEYAYDGDGNMVEMTDDIGTTTMVYDQRNDLVSRTTPDGVTVSYEYDGVGNLASVTDPGGTVSYSYNASNLLGAVFDTSGQATLVSYDRDFNRTAVRYPNGVSMFSTYDEAKRLKKISSVDEKLTTLLSFEYSYEHPLTSTDTSLRQSVTDKDGNVTAYSYDSLNRLVQATTTAPGGALLRDEQYSYDGAGNRKTQTVYDGTKTAHAFYGYNDANQLVNFNGLATFTYDENGNHTGSSLGASHSYNAKDQTTSIRTLGGVPVDMDYRGAGQSERTAVKALGQPLLRFTHAQVGMTIETLGAVERYYMYDDTGQVLTQRSPAGTLYVLTDGLGSTVGLTDSGGRLVGTLEYSAFGETSKATGVADLMPLRFGGAYLDPTGLYKMGHRYYDPALGRFTQQDPIHDPLDPKQWNRYLYVGGDPVNWADPSGLSSCKDDWWNPGGWVDCAAKAGRAVGGFAQKCWNGFKKVAFPLALGFGIGYAPWELAHAAEFGHALRAGGAAAAAGAAAAEAGKLSGSAIIGGVVVVGTVVVSCIAGHRD